MTSLCEHDKKYFSKAKEWRHKELCLLAPLYPPLLNQPSEERRAATQACQKEMETIED